MPSPAEILENLRLIADANVAYAAGWHVLLAGAVVVSLVRRSPRLAAWTIVGLCASVSAFAWRSGNPFNGGIFAALSSAGALLALCPERGAPRVARAGVRALGALLLVFGWVYPHFVQVPTVFTYLYAAPTGIIPCPTLSVAIAFGLLGWLPRRAAWSWILGGAGVVYGLFGVLRLGVALDLVLLAGALALLFSTRGQRRAQGPLEATAGASSSAKTPASSSIVASTQ